MVETATSSGVGRVQIDPTTGPVVALESTIFSELGLPAPHNRSALDRCWAAVEAAGATPALTAVLDGTATVGVTADRFDRICGPARKVAARDLAVAIGQGWAYGATTVSASLTLAAAAGVEVFATGGIGGVHRGAERTGDVSADLEALARYPVVTVSAGAKVFLDLARTVEHLETESVPVLGWRCDEFPAFHAPASGLPVAHRVESAAEVAAIARAHWALGGGGVLVVAPVADVDGIPFDQLSSLAQRATIDVDAAGVTGNAVTPAVLARMSELSDGRTIAANLALAEHNASVAGAIASALSRSSRPGRRVDPPIDRMT
jgi:pseudouridine-5'-phosphate glycosidase